jgi:hypothetical protein
VEGRGFGINYCGSYFLITVDGRPASDALGVDWPRSGRVSISELAVELAKAEANRNASKTD